MKLPDLKTVKDFILDFKRDVIRMMRLHFIMVAMAILIGVFLVMLTAINIIMNTVSESQSMTLLRQIADSDRYNTIEGFNGGGNGNEDPPIPPNGTDEPPDGAFHQDGTVPSEETPPPMPSEETNSAALMQGGLIALSEDFGGRGGWGNGWMPRPGENWGQPPPEDFDDGDFDDMPVETDDDDFDDVPPWERDNGNRQRPSEDFQPPTDAQPPAMTEAPAPQETPPPASEEPTPPPVEESPADEQPTPDAPPPEQVQETPPAAPPASDAAPATEVPTPAPADTTEPETTPPPALTDASGNSQPPREFREPRMDRWKVPITIDHFAIFVDQEGGFLGLRNTEDYTEEEAEEIMEGILAKKKTQGMYGWLQFCTAEKSYGTLIVITDKTSDQGLLNNLFRATVIIGVIMLIVLLVILIFLSRWITAPVQQAFKRQKQFVSDAGHELKTPIAVLTTNADILQDEIGENKWLVYMQEQIGRMNQLVGDLLRLARMDNATQEYVFEDFDLSMAVAATTLPFESAAFEQHKNLEMDVQPEVHYRGSEQHIRQLCAIFIDNALKYSNDNGIIKVTLLQRGDHAVLEFYNTGCEISPEETEKIFERFYRGDKARNSTKKSGYGLGLAIARSIMDVHKIKIHVTCEQGKWIRFLLTL